VKYNPEDYIDTGFYPADEDIANYKEKIVKCRKPHKCMGGCGKEIQAGEQAVRETGFLLGEPVSNYTCLPCIEEWLEESGQIDDTEVG
jgi:hypothetical protein